jgi:3-hydroxymyristoyl/3-hydroxydecanoyl-(acyl carrier protein) dehydratase
MLDATRRRTGTMAALIGADRDAVESLTTKVRDSGGEVWVANVNAPGQIVVSGTVSGVAQVASMASEHGFKAIDLAVGGAFHSPLMRCARPALAVALDKALFNHARVPVVANFDARPHVEQRAWPSLLVSQLTAPVRWEEGIRVLCDELGCGCLVEVGPGPHLLTMARRIVPASRRIIINHPTAAQRDSAATIASARAAGGDPPPTNKHAPWSLIHSTIKLQSRVGRTAVVMIDVDAAEPLFAGHFPALPILPGVSLIECVHRAMKLAAPQELTDAEVSVVEKARFVDPVFPGDRVTMNLRWDADVDGWRCAAELATERGAAARVRLRLATAEAAR